METDLTIAENLSKYVTDSECGRWYCQVESGADNIPSVLASNGGLWDLVGHSDSSPLPRSASGAPRLVCY